MRNVMSPGRTPSQHNSTLAISPFIANRSNRQSQTQQQSQLRAQSRPQTSNDEQHRSSDRRNSTDLNHSRIDNFQAIVSSPLGPKTVQDVPVTSLTTPYQQSKTNMNTSTGTNLASRSKNSIFGYAVPSTIRKVSIREMNPRDSTQKKDQHNIDDLIEEPDRNGGNQLTTTLTTTTSSTTADIDISELSSVERLRLWRHDALMQHMYDTAEYIGNKIYTITNDPNDAFWLAQVYYDKGSYIRAIDLLSTDNLDEISIMCRYLITLCLFNLQKYDEALDVIGESNPFSNSNESDEDGIVQSDGGIKIESSLCFVRGKIYSAQNNFIRAKECFREAVLIDVKNFEAFQHLTSKNLLTPQEEWELLDSLDFSSLGDNKEMIKHLYTTNCSSLVNKEKILNSQSVLIEEYSLESNIDLVSSKIAICYTGCRFNECLELSEACLEKDELNPKILPVYISCLYELGAKNKLFLVSHNLAEKIPKSSITWFAVATYYMTIKRIHEARKYYSKSLILDPSFASAWLGFVHTFAMEGEQDQALAAYSTAARFFPGNHLPNLFLGMQYMSSNNFALAEEYFTLSFDICPQDPLLLNEMGVMYFKKEEFEKSKKFLNKAMEQIKELNPTSRTAISIQMNLAHTYRKLGDNERAIKCFKYVLEDSEKDSDIYLTLGFLYLKTKQLEKAINYLHKALALKPKNTAAQELLLHALELNIVLAIDDDHPLVVNSKIQDDIDNISGSINRSNRKLNEKKRSSISFFDSNGFSKKSRKNGSLEDTLTEFGQNNEEDDGEEDEDEEGDEMMDLE